jgi:hypothetical protein
MCNKMQKLIDTLEAQQKGRITSPYIYIESDSEDQEVERFKKYNKDIRNPIMEKKHKEFIKLFMDNVGTIPHNETLTGPGSKEYLCGIVGPPPPTQEYNYAKYMEDAHIFEGLEQILANKDTDNDSLAENAEFLKTLTDHGKIAFPEGQED